jgi:hypothetical protein
MGVSLAAAKFLHSDHLGSTRVCTDASSNATGQCAYEPFRCEAKTMPA